MPFRFRLIYFPDAADWAQLISSFMRSSSELTTVDLVQIGGAGPSRDVGKPGTSLFLISPQWISEANENPLRLADEIGIQASSRHAIPVFVDGVGVPSSGDFPAALAALFTRNAFFLDPRRQVDHELARLTHAIGMDRLHSAYTATQVFGVCLATATAFIAANYAATSTFFRTSGLITYSNPYLRGSESTALSAVAVLVLVLAITVPLIVFSSRLRRSAWLTLGLSASGLLYLAIPGFLFGTSTLSQFATSDVALSNVVALTPALVLVPFSAYMAGLFGGERKP